MSRTIELDPNSKKPRKDIKGVLKEVTAERVGKTMLSVPPPAVPITEIQMDGTGRLTSHRLGVSTHREEMHKEGENELTKILQGTPPGGYARSVPTTLDFSSRFFDFSAEDKENFRLITAGVLYTQFGVTPPYRTLEDTLSKFGKDSRKAVKRFLKKGK